MARPINHVVLIGALLVSAYVIEGASIADWMNRYFFDLNRNLSNMFQQINEQINEQTAYLTDSIERDVNEMIQNLPRDAQGNIISTNGSSIVSVNNGSKVVTIVDGVSKSITSGQTANGEPYVCIVEEKRIGDMLYYNKTTFNPKTGASDTVAWKLDLAIPGAKPEIITNTKTDEK